MSNSIPITNLDFKQIKNSSVADKRGRLTIGTVAKQKNYRVAINSLGQILLDPIVSVPQRESWLWQNQAASQSLKQGLIEASENKITDLGSFADYADIDIE